jgi:TolB protein
VVAEPHAGSVFLPEHAAGMRHPTASLTKEDTMTAHDSRPAVGTTPARAAPRGASTDPSRGPRGAARAVLVAASVGTLLGPGPIQASAEPELRPAIVFTSTRDASPPDLPRSFSGAEIYLMLMKPNGTPDGTAPRRLTTNSTPDAFAVLSPDGKQIVFESNRIAIAAGEPRNTSDLFLMKSDGTQQRLLTRGSSATWSPDGTRIAFHASASGTGQAVNPTVPGVPTCDSDIFVARVSDLLDSGTARTNLTNTPGYLDYDADWSPDGKKIAFVRYPKQHDCPPDRNDPEQPNPPNAEIYVMNADGTGLQQLTFNSGGTAAPDWSPDGKRIAYMCRPAAGAFMDICVINADGTHQKRLTRTSESEGTPIWSPDGRKILFSRQFGEASYDLFVMNDEGKGETQLTDNLGFDFMGSWGLLKVTGS